MAIFIYDNSGYVVHRPNEVVEIKVGDFITQHLYSDTLVHEVIKTTAKTITVRSTAPGEIIHREDVNGNGWPKIWREAIPNENGAIQTLKERKRKSGQLGYYSFDGRYQVRTARKINGKPCTLTDYRY